MLIKYGKKKMAENSNCIKIDIKKLFLGNTTMRFLLTLLLSFLARVIFSLRYRVKVKGKECLKKNNFRKDVGILFLPNHPALVDPVFISMYIWPRFRVRPLVVEYVYRQKWINSLMKLLGALPIPNMDTSLNEVKIQNAEKVIDKIIEGLKKGENYVLYPSGRLKHTGKEIIGGASATEAIIQGVKDVNIVLIRTSGLWGSSLSRAYTGYSPDLKTMALRGIKDIFKSLIFFMPKRDVLIEIENAKEDFPREGTRLEVNRYLESWYNRYPVDGEIVEVEPLKQVSYSVWKNKFYEPLVRSKERKSYSKRTYSSKVEEVVYGELSRLQPDIVIDESKHLASDLGLDSLDIAEFIAFLHLHFDIGEVHPEDIETVADVLDVAEGRAAKKTQEVKHPTYFWPKEGPRPDITFPLGKTIFESFLLNSDRMANFSACGDDMLGPMSYKKFKIAALIFAKELQKIEGKHIGVLLPASCAAYLVILAVQLAGKVPVMLNWTLGPRYLNHMITLTDTKAVISSWKFLERISNTEFGSLTQKLILLEDLKKDVSKGAKIRALFLSLKKAPSLIKALKLDKIKEEDEAVILFTSGTESNPKGVPLTHKNIISNLTAALSCIKLYSSDIMYGFLPPFHSFGFSVSGIFPLIAGMKVAYSPDPTDSYTLAEGISRWNITIFCAAPSFLKGILQAATKDQLKTVRFFVAGAEKVSKEIYEKIKGMGEGKKLIEGYGITECSPVLTLTREEKEPIGVGELLPGIEFCTVHPETHKKLSSVHEEGEMCVFGPSIFNGYLGEKKDPFVTLDGKKWYCSGDLGYLDKGGNVILSGRLKRFTKIGGEMISLGSIEEIILKELRAKNIDLGEGVPIAVCSLEKEGGKSELVLVSTLDLDKADVNLILKDSGCSRIIKISKVMKIDSIPLMGTGKTDYRFIQKIIESSENI